VHRRCASTSAINRYQSDIDLPMSCALRKAAAVLQSLSMLKRH
jgi:hypothetical protein